MAATITVKLVKSPIGTPRTQRANLRGLGLNKISDSRELIDSPSVRGMIRQVGHLLTVAEGGGTKKRKTAAAKSAKP